MSARLLLVLALLRGATSLAQPCCVGATALGSARLTTHEDALVGLGLRAGVVTGSFDDRLRFHPASADASELDLEQSLLGALRLFEKAQLALTAPVVETYRSARRAREFGGGLGDVSVSMRYDFLLAGESRRVPGLGLFAGVTLPTGRPPEASLTPLGTTSTGAGVWAGSLGVSAEQSWGNAFASVMVVGMQSLPRTTLGITQLLGPQLTLTGVGGWAFDDAAVSASVSWLVTGPATVNGELTDGTARSQWTLGVAGAYTFIEVWRLQGALTTHLPIDGGGRNEPMLLRFSLSLLRTWS